MAANNSPKEDGGCPLAEKLRIDYDRLRDCALHGKVRAKHGEFSREGRGLFGLVARSDVIEKDDNSSKQKALEWVSPSDPLLISTVPHSTDPPRPLQAVGAL